VYVCVFCNSALVLVICVLVFTVFYIYDFLLVFSILPPSDNKIAISSGGGSSSSNNNVKCQISRQDS
jgi:hypothetical protein